MRIRKLTPLLIALAISLSLSNPTASAFSTHQYVSRFSGSMTPAGSFSSLEDIAANQTTGNVYMADRNHGVVDVFSSSGAYLSQLTQADGVTPYGLGGLEMVTVDQATGGVYVSDINEGVIDVFSSSGAYLAQLGKGTLSVDQRLGVAVDNATGDVYVADQGPRVVYVFSPAGALLSTWTGASTPNHAITAEAVGVDQSSHDVYVPSFGSVYKLDSSGNYLSQLTQADGVTPFIFTQPWALTVDSSGDVYVVDKLAAAVYEFGPSGALLAEIPGTPDGPFVLPLGVAVGSTGDVYVADNVYNGIPVADIFAPPIIVLPDVTTGAASNVSAASATISGTVNPDSTATTYQFQYGPGMSYGQLSPAAPTGVGSDNLVHNLTANLAGLSPNTTYHYRLSATNSNGTIYGQDDTLMTPAIAPTVSGQPPSADGIGRTSALLSGTINPEDSPTTYYVAYGPTADYGSVTPGIYGGSGGSDEAVGVTVDRLTPGTTYHYALVAANQAGTVSSPDQTFTTAPPTPPVVSTGGASGVDQTEATLAGTVDPRGLNTTYQLEIGTGTSYGRQVPGPTLSGTGAQAVSVTLRGLSVGGTYHYRIAASNADGTSYGADQTFTTPGLPLIVPSAPAFIAAPLSAFPTDTGSTSSTPKSKKCRKGYAKKRGKCVKSKAQHRNRSRRK
jgi:hypothetical protein